MVCGALHRASGATPQRLSELLLHTPTLGDINVVEYFRHRVGLFVDTIDAEETSPMLHRGNQIWAVPEGNQLQQLLLCTQLTFLHKFSVPRQAVEVLLQVSITRAVGEDDSKIRSYTMRRDVSTGSSTVDLGSNLILPKY